MSREAVIEAAGLTKTYNGFTAVDRLNLKVAEGEIFGFLGPNGAGKTTTIIMLLGLSEPSAGRALVGGFDATREPLKVKRIAGYLAEHVGFYEDLSAEDNLRFIARLNGLSSAEASRRIGDILPLVGLSGVGRHRVETFSRGMKQRLGIAGVLLKEPRVVFLDEPTSGLDPEGASQVLDLITRLSREEKITVFISSHLLYQVQRVCHRVGIMSRGRLVAVGSIEALGREVLAGGQVVTDLEVDGVSPKLLELLKGIKGVERVEQSGKVLTISCAQDVRAQISRAIFEAGAQVLQMRLRGYGLEEIYMKYFHEG